MQTHLRCVCIRSNSSALGLQQHLAAPSCLALKCLYCSSWCRYTNTYPLCLSLLEQGAINCEPLITHRYGFSADEVAKGFDTAMNAKVNKSIKVMFHL